MLMSCTALTQATTLGLNSNGLGNKFTASGIDGTDKEWIRMFVPILDQDNTNLVNNSRVQPFKVLAENSKYKAVLSIKWDFKGNNLRIPENDTPEMQAYIQKLEDLLDYMGADIDRLVIGNEPMFETQAADRVNIPGRGIPQVIFYKRMANIANNWRNAHNAKFSIYVGAFNRLDLTANINAPDVQGLFTFAENTSWIAGVDVHAHVANLTEFENNFKAARDNLIESKDLISTEWSLVKQWSLHYNDKIGDTYAQKYGLDKNLTIIEHLNELRVNKIYKAQWNDFLVDKSWWIKDLPARCKTIMNTYGVSLATYAYSNDDNMGTITNETTPWFLNGLYQPAFIVAGTDQRHAFIFDSFKEN